MSLYTNEYIVSCRETASRCVRATTVVPGYTRLYTSTDGETTSQGYLWIHRKVIFSSIQQHFYLNQSLSLYLQHEFKAEDWVENFLSFSSQLHHPSSTIF